MEENFYDNFKMDVTKKHDYINIAVDNGDLSVQELGVYLVLIRFVSSELGYSFPSLNDIMRCANIGKKDTLLRYIESLILKKYIIRDSGKKGKNTRYYFVKKSIVPKIGLVPELGSPQNRDSGSPQNEDPVVPKIGTLKENKKKIKRKYYKEKNSADVSFANAETQHVIKENISETETKQENKNVIFNQLEYDENGIPTHESMQQMLYDEMYYC